MEDRLRELERKVEALTETVRRLEARLPGDAGAPAPGEAPAPAAEAPSTAPAAAPPAPAGPLDVTGAASLVGRSLLVVGGAFLIRALTERSVVAPGVGVTLGLAFAALWLVLAWRADAAQRLSATFHGATAALIGYPLVYETATRLGVLSASTAALVLVAFSGLMLVVAGRHSLRLLAWVGVGGGVAVAALLLRNTEAPTALCLALLALALATHLLAELRGWTGPRWVVALVLDVVVLRRVFKLAAAESPGPGELGVALAAAQATVLLYVGAVAVRTWWRDAKAGAFELVQTALVLGVGLATAGRVHDVFTWVPTAAGVVALALALGALVTAARLSDRAERGLDVWFYGVAGLGLILAGGPFLVRGWPLTLLWAGLAIASALLGRAGHTRMLWGFSLLLGIAAAGSGGALGDARDGFVGAPGGAWSPLTLESAAAMLAAVVCYALMALPAKGKDTADVRVRLLPGAVLLLALLVLGGATVHAVRALLGGAGADAGVVILARTLLLAAAALALGAARRLGAPPETAWAAWGVLGACAMKLAVQDLPGGRPSTLFVAFLAVGACVIALPRLIRRARGAADAP